MANEVLTLDSETVPAVRVVGRVSWFNRKMGYGAVDLGKSGRHFWPSAFVHHSNVRCALWELRRGRMVEFNLRMTARGPVAEDLTTFDRPFGMGNTDETEGAI